MATGDQTWPIGQGPQNHDRGGNLFALAANQGFFEICQN
jgi:hypothetical protein